MGEQSNYYAYQILNIVGDKLRSEDSLAQPDTLYKENLGVIIGSAVRYECPMYKAQLAGQVSGFNADAVVIPLVDYQQ